MCYIIMLAREYNMLTKRHILSPVSNLELQVNWLPEAQVMSHNNTFNQYAMC